MKKLQLKSLVLGPVSTNCYLAMNKETRALLIVDPADAPERIVQAVTEMKATPEAILLTHGHFDHIGAAEALREQYHIPVCALEQEREVLEDAEKNLTGSWMGRGYTLQPDRWFADGEQTVLAGFSVEVIHTPGHTVGGACYYLPQEQVLFSGDTLFCCSVGRTDLPTGNAGALRRSIHEKLFVLPDATEVFPGHDEQTTLAYEKRYNPY